MNYTQENWEKISKKWNILKDHIKPEDMIGGCECSGAYFCPYCLDQSGTPSYALLHVTEEHSDKELFYCKSWELSIQEQIQTLVNCGLSEKKAVEVFEKMEDLHAGHFIHLKNNKEEQDKWNKDET